MGIRPLERMHQSRDAQVFARDVGELGESANTALAVPALSQDTAARGWNLLIR